MNNHILLVEDDPSDIELAKRAIEKQQIPAELILAEDGQEALDYLLCTGKYEGANVPLPAVMLLDLKLPKVDGLAVLQQVRANERTRALPVVILTTSTEQADMLASYNFGANSYVRKPVDLAEFYKIVAHLGTYWLGLNQTPWNIK